MGKGGGGGRVGGGGGGGGYSGGGGGRTTRAGGGGGAYVHPDVAQSDAAITAGALYLDRRTIQLPSAGGTVGGTLSLVTHIFVSEWMSLNFEVRNITYLTPLASAEGDVLANVATMTLGVGFYLPTQVTRSKDPNEPEDQ